MASEVLPFGLVGPAVPGEVTSAELIPGSVIPSEPRAGFGVAAELSPLDTAIPSCALRAAPSVSPAISYTSLGRAPGGGEPPLQSPIVTEYTLIPSFSAAFQGDNRKTGRRKGPAFERRRPIEQS